jgi:hypothetical protein
MNTTNATLKSEDGRFFIEAQWLQELGIDVNGDVEILREGGRLVVQAARDTRLQRLSADLESLMARHSEALPHAR